MEKVDNSLRNLPDDIFLRVLQYCEEVEIEDTREFQSNWVQECTKDVCIGCAISKQNLCNMNWIEERYNGICLHRGHDSYYEEEVDSSYEDELNDFYVEEEEMYDEMGFEFYEEGRFYDDDDHDDEEIHDDEECRDGVIVKPNWLDNAMGEAMGNLGVMKWIHKHGVSWSENTFQLAVEHGDIEIIEWLYKKECPWNTTIEACRVVVPVNKPEVLQWMQDNGCPDM